MSNEMGLKSVVYPTLWYKRFSIMSSEMGLMPRDEAIASLNGFSTMSNKKGFK